MLAGLVAVYFFFRERVAVWWKGMSSGTSNAIQGIVAVFFASYNGAAHGHAVIWDVNAVAFFHFSVYVRSSKVSFYLSPVVAYAARAFQSCIATYAIFWHFSVPPVKIWKQQSVSLTETEKCELVETVRDLCSQNWEGRGACYVRFVPRGVSVIDFWLLRPIVAS